MSENKNARTSADGPVAWGCQCGRAYIVTCISSKPTKQEPVAWRTFDGEGGYDYRSYEMNENYDKEWAERNPNHAHWVEPLYTAPSKQWVGLTDEERHGIREWQEIQKELGPVWAPMMLYLYLAIEAKLKEKNT